MSYVQYTRPKAPSAPCGALNVRGMGQDSSDDSAPAPLPVPTVPSNPLSIFSNLFSSTDFASWGVGEWLVIAGVGFLALRLIQGVFSTGKSVKRAYRKRKRRSARKSKLQSQMESL